MESLSTVITSGKPLSPNFQTFQKIEYLHSQLELGRHIFPMRELFFDDAGGITCDCRAGATCVQAGKHPAILWGNPWDPNSEWTRKAVVNHVTKSPSRGYGLHVGHSGLAVLDIDARHGGVENLRELCRQYGYVIPEYTTCSSGGGGHVYYHAPIHAQSVRGFIGANGESRVTIVIAPGVELFFGQHLVVLPFSPHKSGCWYTVGPNQDVLPLPQWLLNLVLAKDVFKVAERPARKSAAIRGAAHHSAEAPNVERARAYLQKIPGAVSGEGGSAATARVASLLLIDFGLEYDDAYQLLSEWNATCSPPWTVTDLHRKLYWASCRPGERGWKNTPRERPKSAEDIAIDALDTTTFRIDRVDHWLITTGGVKWVREYKPREPVDYAAELAGFTPEEKIEAIAETYFRNWKAKEWCFRRTGLLFDNEETHTACRAAPCCGCEGCEGCYWRELRRRKESFTCSITMEHAKRKFSEHFRMWRAYVPVDDFDNVVRAVRKKGGRWGGTFPEAVGDWKGTRALIFSTLPTSNADWVSVTAEECINQMHGALEAIPQGIKGFHKYRKCKQWKLLKDPPPKQKLGKLIGKTKLTAQKFKEISEKWSYEVISISCMDNWDPIDFQFAKYRADQRDAYFDDLDVGEYWGGKNPVISSNKSDEHAEWCPDVEFDDTGQITKCGA